MKRVRVRPGKTQSMVGFIMGLIFTGIGVFFVIPVFGPFGLAWTGMAIVITAISGYNAFSDKGVVSHEIVIDEENITESNQNSPEEDEKDRLVKLRELYDARLITEEEYEQKRRKILDEM